MIKTVLLLLLVCYGLADYQYSPNQMIEKECSTEPFTIHFKPIRQFSIILQSQHFNIKADKQVRLQDKQHNCTLTQTNQICVFDNFTRSLNIQCKQASTIKIRITKAELLGYGSFTLSKLVEIELEKQEHGIISMYINQRMAAHIRNNKNQTFLRKFVKASDCIEFIDIYGFQMRFAIINNHQSTRCSISFLQQQTHWFYYNALKQIKIVQQSYNDYLTANGSRQYLFESRGNITLELIIEAEKVDQDLTVQIEFINNNTMNTYQLQNFEKGLSSVSYTVYFNKTFNKIRIQSNKNLFYRFFVEHTLKPFVESSQDQYLYLQMQEEPSHFLISLQNVNQQNLKNKKMYLFRNSNQPVDLSYVQCSTQNCLQKSNISLYKTPDDNYIVPKCQNLIRQQCYLHFRMKGTPGKVIGFLPFVPLDRVQLIPNKLLTATVKYQKIAMHYVSQKHLKEGASEITVNLFGARGYMTYDAECNRISCCQYNIKAQSIIPNQKKQLKIFIIGTSYITIQYRLIIHTTENNKFLLHDSVITNSVIQPNEQFKYYTYQTSSQEDVEINFSSDQRSVKMYINFQSEDFPSEETHDLMTMSSITISGKSLKKLILITLAKSLQTLSQAIHYSITVSKISANIQLPWHVPYIHRLVGNTSKSLVLNIHNEVRSRSVILKLDSFNPDYKEGVLIQILNNKKTLWKNFTISKLTTIKLSSEIINKDLCPKTEAQSICNTTIKLINPTNTTFEVQLEAQFSAKQNRLQDGRIYKMNTGATGDIITSFFIDISNGSKGINIYVASTEVKVQIATTIHFFNDQTEQMIYPKFEYKPPLNRYKPPAFGNSIYYRPEDLAFPKDKKYARVLIAIRDLYTEGVHNKLDVFVNGAISIGYSTGLMNIKDNQQFTYVVQQNQTQKFVYMMGALSLRRSELYILTKNIVGKSLTKFQVYSDNKVIYEKNTSDSDIIIVNLDEIKKLILQTDTALVIQVNAEGGWGQFSTEITSSASPYRQIKLGHSMSFFIRKGGSTVFSFVDNYNEDFQIKINRREGIPEYRFTSCKPEEHQLKCLESFKTTQLNVSNTQSYQVLGRSHELQVHKKSEHYCKNCIYYLILYAIQKDIEGQILLTRKGTNIILEQGKPTSTFIAYQEVQIYEINKPKQLPVEIIISPHMGNITIYTSANQNESYYIYSNATNKALTISLDPEKTNEMIKIKVVNQFIQNAYYSILFTSSNPIELADGMPWTQTIKNLTQFRYRSEADTYLTVVSGNKDIQINILCNNVSTSGQRTNWLTNMMMFYMQKCNSSNKIVIETTIETEITLIANTLDITLLPLNFAFSGFIPSKSSWIYEILLSEKTHLVFILKKCKNAMMRIQLSSDKKSILSNSTQLSFNAANPVEVFQRTLPPGVVYMKLSSLSQSVEYTIMVKKQVEFKYDYIQLESPAIIYNQISQSQNNFEFWFSPYMIHGSQKYEVQYKIVESVSESILSAFTTCGIQKAGELIRQETITAISKQDKFYHFTYYPEYSDSYITIVPTFTPPLQPQTQVPSYRIIRLPHGMNILKRIFAKATNLVSVIGNIQDQNIAGALVIIIFLALGFIAMCITSLIFNRYLRNPVVVHVPYRPGKNGNNSLEMIQESTTERTLV